MKTTKRCKPVWIKKTIIVLLALFISTMPALAQEIGKVYYGFKLIKMKEISEMGGVGKLFEHEKTGAKLLKIETDDENKTFAISFRTNPKTDEGIAHVVEHSVMLGGSKKYPVKSSFETLSKGSLYTFLNAITCSEHTEFPIASKNEKDFFNLIDVYLDAVFFPRVYEEPKIFKEQAWHYELEDKEAELKINGVVYNEMKGAFSSPSYILSYYIYKNLFPDNIYRFSSGGYPPAIPSLTYEEALEFHKAYYHPSNSYIFLHGNGNTLEELKFLDTTYLSGFDKKTVDANIPLQKSFDSMKEIIESYPISSGETEQDKTFLSLNYVTGKMVQRDLTMVLNVLTEVLVNSNSSPVKKALSEAGIGQDVSASLEELQQNVFSCVVTNANESDKEKFKSVFFETLNDVVKNGIDKKALNGAISRMEFNLREERYNYMRWPKVLNNMYYAIMGWMYANDPFLTLEYEKSLMKLKEALYTDYFEKIVEQYLINNNHCLLAVLVPKKGLEEENSKKLKIKLAEFKATLSEKEIEKIVKQTHSLKEYQAEPDTPENLSKIPLLSIDNIKPDAERMEVNVRELAGVKVLHYPKFTNNVIYLNLLFNASVVPQKLIPYVALLGDIIGDINTKNYPNGELNTELNIYGGGLDFNIEIYSNKDDHQAFLPKFAVNSKALTSNFRKFIELQSEIIKNSKFKDKQRLKQVILELKSYLKSERMLRRGMWVAETRLESYFLPAGKYKELTYGLSYYKFIADLVEDFDNKSDDIISNLEKAAQLLFNRENLIVGITCSQNDYKSFVKHFPILLDSLSDRQATYINYSFDFKDKNEGLMTSSKLQNVIKGYNYKELGYSYSGKFSVLNKILSREYLRKNIRNIGGAYGSFSSFSKNGLVYFISYQDPNIGKTLRTYDQAADFLRNFQTDNREMTRFIIGTIAETDQPLLPYEKGKTAISNYFENISYADIQNERHEILNTNQEDIRKMAGMISEILLKNYFCVCGNEQKLKENKDIFNKLINVFVK